MNQHGSCQSSDYNGLLHLTAWTPQSNGWRGRHCSLYTLLFSPLLTAVNNKLDLLTSDVFHTSHISTKRLHLYYYYYRSFRVGLILSLRILSATCRWKPLEINKHYLISLSLLMYKMYTHITKINKLVEVDCLRYNTLDELHIYQLCQPRKC